MTRRQILYRTAEALTFPALFFVIFIAGGMFQ